MNFIENIGKEEIINFFKMFKMSYNGQKVKETKWIADEIIEYNKQKIIELYNNNQLKYFIVGIVQRQYNSITSPFYKKYKKYYSIIDANVINKDDVNEDDE